MRSGSLLPRWTDRLRGMQLPVPFSMTEFCEQLAERRNREIVLVPISFGVTQISGLWVADEQTDMIFYERDTTPLHQQHIQFHELGHMLSDRPHAAGPDTAWMQQLLPNIDVGRVESLLARSSYDADAELEAERFAREMGATVRHAQRPRRAAANAADARAADVRARALQVFGRPW